MVQVTGTNWPKPAYTLLVTGLCRLKVEELLQETPYPVATVTQLDQLPDKDLGKTTVHFVLLNPNISFIEPCLIL